LSLERDNGITLRFQARDNRAGEGQMGCSGQVIFRQAKFSVGQIVRHRLYPFRGVIYDVDPIFNNSEEWYQSIPADRRPSKDQPFYHLLAQNAQGGPYEAYVSEQNLLPDANNGPISHPMIYVMFEKIAGDRYQLRPQRRQ
jgi:heat shock protein HspQ